MSQKSIHLSTNQLAPSRATRTLQIGKFPCAFWKLSPRPGLTTDVATFGSLSRDVGQYPG